MEYRILQYLIYSVVLNIYINSVQMAFSNPSLWFSPPSSNIYYPLLHFYCCMTICIYRNSFIHQYCSEMVSFFSDSSWWIDIGSTHRRDSWNSNHCQINHLLFNQCRMEVGWILFRLQLRSFHLSSHILKPISSLVKDYPSLSLPLSPKSLLSPLSQDHFLFNQCWEWRWIYFYFYLHWYHHFHYPRRKTNFFINNYNLSEANWESSYFFLLLWMIDLSNKTTKYASPQ